MLASEFPYTHRIVGGIHNPRRRVDAAVAFDAYRRCDARARVDEESYLGVFRFDERFAEHLAKTGSTRDFVGPTWSDHVWWDVDRGPDAGGIEQAILDTGRLIGTLVERYAVPEECLLPFISGGKGCHLGVPTALWSPVGGESFHLVTREFAVRIADEAGVAVDSGIYDRVRAFRSPNSRHPKTRLHKRFVPPQQFGLLTMDDALILASRPAPFELVDVSCGGTIPTLVAAWQAAADAVVAKQTALDRRRQELAAAGAEARVNRQTLDLIRGEPVAVGDRHRTIYSAARNLAESGASRHLVFELLREAALDTGLPPREVDRQIECGVLAAAPYKT